MITNEYGQKVMYATDLVNLTGDEIRIYEDKSGGVRKFLPVGFKVPNSSYSHDKDVYYVVERRMLNDYLADNRTLDDVALLSERSVGRRNKVVTYLVWAKDREVHIRLRSK